MDETLLPPDEDASLGALMARATSLALGLICLARAALSRYGDAALPAAVARQILRRFIRPAEATVRRAILVLAATLTPPAVQQQSMAKRQVKLPPATGQGPRRPVFRLTEPLPATRQSGPFLKPEEMPRITVFDAFTPRRSVPVMPLPDKHPKADDAAISARLLRRLSALEGAFNDPLREARRFLRRRARSLAAAKGVPLPPPLAFARIPGNGRHLHEAFRHVLEDMNMAAQETLSPLPDSS